jgi:hypothetical protein
MSGITQTQCTQLKLDLLSSYFTSGSFKLALYGYSAALDNTTTAYTTVGEITGTGYTAGGAALTVIPPAADSVSNTAYVSFQPVTWTPASFTCVGGLIYNATTGHAVCVLSFGSIRTASNSFTVTFPTFAASTAIIRIS